MKTLPKIKFIVNHYVSKTDMYGNRYWFATVTSAVTGRHATFYSDHKSTTNHAILDIGINWENIVSCEHELAIREFNRMRKASLTHTGYLSKEDITNLAKDLEGDA